MDLVLYPKLGARSRRAILGEFGSSYRPRRALLTRLSRETGMTVNQVRLQLQKERKYLLATFCSAL